VRAAQLGVKVREGKIDRADPETTHQWVSPGVEV
jgi:hypothetical protein